MSSRLPDFIIGGTLPAGTGHLYGLLVQHPEIHLAPPMQPECNFFFKSAEYRKGLGYYRERWFADVRGRKAVGERSSLVLSGGARAAERIARDLPGVKLLFLLRNPVDRAYANYRFTALAGYEDLSFEEALAREEERIAEAHAKGEFWGEIQPHAYFARGLYADQLEPFRSLLPAGRILVMRSDALLADQDGALRGIYRFLGVDESFVAAPFADYSSPAVRDVRLQAALRREFPDGFDGAVQRIRGGLPPEGEIDRRVRANVCDGYEKLSPAVRAGLTARYEEANRRLAPTVPFSIEDWLPS